MTILHVAARYWPELGGVETHVRELSRVCVKRGNRVLVVTEQTNQRQSMHEHHEGVEIVRLRFGPREKPNYKLSVWKTIWQHRKIFQSADIIHVHDIFWWLLPLYPFVSHKVAITFHGWEGQFPVRWQAKLQRLLYNKLARGVIHVGDWIKEFYWDKPDEVIYGGVQLQPSKAEKKRSAEAQSQVLNAVFAGRLVPENAIEKYVALVAALKQQGIQVRMQWAGDGPERSVAAQVGKVLGWQSSLTAAIRAADVIFANSYLTMWEALAAGKPVVALSPHSLKEKYLQTFPAQEALILGSDPKEVAQHLLALWRQPKIWRALSQTARTAARGHSWERVADQYQRLWTERLGALGFTRQRRLTSLAPVQLTGARPPLKNKPVSVIVTVRNEVESIESLLTSLRQQTLRPDEIIIVDANSTDGTWEQLQKLSTRYPNLTLRLFQHESNRSQGRNYAIQKAQHDWIAITDAGCVAEPQWLAELLYAVESTGAEVVAGYAVGAPETAFEEAVVPYVMVMPDRVDPENYLPATRSMIMSKKAWHTVGGFNDGLNYSEDYWFAKQLVKHGVTLAFAPDARVRWRPSASVLAFARMTAAIAQGDVQAGVMRRKVWFIFARYIVGTVLVGSLLSRGETGLTLIVLSVGVLIYSVWAVVKNLRYVVAGWLWLPVLQIVSDLAVMMGTSRGLLEKRAVSNTG